MERSTRTETFKTQICQVLKLNPEKINTITIKILPDDRVQVTTEENLLVDEDKGILKMFHYYHLVENINGKSF
jgi:hypothetical protein